MRERFGHPGQILTGAAARHLRAGDRFHQATPATWDLEGLAGRLVELTGEEASAQLTAAMGLVLDAQRQGETVVWITPVDHLFFPPDAAAMGIDLAALAVVRVPFAAMAKAADKLTRSGGFGLVVLDMAAKPGEKGAKGDAWLSRLMGLAKRHDTAIVFLTEKGNPACSLGPLVSLRGVAKRRRGIGCFEVEVCIVKDKRGGGARQHRECLNGPPGLC